MLTNVKFILVFLFYIIKGSTPIQNVKLIVPKVVQAGTSATLLCLYDLEGASLYSVQWYRGKFEFFRFVPSEVPSTKVFHTPGLYVDTFASNDHQVTLTDIPVQISGEFSCEITTDAPPFSTSCVSENLTIIDFHLNLDIPKKQYYFGDLIDVNCTLIPKLPSTRLILYWNTKPVFEKFLDNNFFGTILSYINTTIYDTGQKYPVLVQIKCSAILNEMQHTISKTISLKIKPNISAKSRATMSSNSSIFLLNLIIIWALISI